MRLAILLVLCLCAGTSNLIAQNADIMALSQQDVERFIESYSNLAEELKILGEKYEVANEEAVNVQALNAEADAIFRKYGWSNDYMMKYKSVFAAFTYVSVETQLDQSPEAFKKKMMSMLPEFKKSTSDNNIELVRGHYSELNSLIGTPQP